MLREPTLTVFRPRSGKPNGNGRADVARWLTAQGYTAFLLKYRVRGTPPTQAEYDVEVTGPPILDSRSGMSCRIRLEEWHSSPVRPPASVALLPYDSAPTVTTSWSWDVVAIGSKNSSLSCPMSAFARWSRTWA
jgi:hypothetical protein